MAYTDKTTAYIIDKFLTYVDMDEMAENDAHIKDSFAVEHNWNATSIDGTHKNGSIVGAYISTTPVSTGSQQVNSSSSWTPAAGLYNIVSTDNNYPSLQLYISGAWKGITAADTATPGIGGLILFDGTNMRLFNNSTGSNYTVWYQKF